MVAFARQYEAKSNRVTFTFRRVRRRRSGPFGGALGL